MGSFAGWGKGGLPSLQPARDLSLLGEIKLENAVEKLKFIKIIVPTGELSQNKENIIALRKSVSNPKFSEIDQKDQQHHQHSASAINQSNTWCLIAFPCEN